MAIECETCYRDFVDWHAARQHMNAVGHWACERCSATFWTEESAEDHMDYLQHRLPRFECEACDAEFFSQQDAKKHMDSQSHWRVHWCRSCARGFQSENNLRMHLNSNIHRGSDITCPFCLRAFTTATGVAAHLEAGSCPNAHKLNRDTILREIRRRDPNHIITKKLLEGSSSTPSSITATEATYNPVTGYYECYLCHRKFCTIRALNQHVNSPAHRSTVYHCPGGYCGKEFVSLAALFNHLESESCGTMRFETVQKNVGQFLTGRKAIAFN